jgi:hypothetical protein
MTILIIPLRDDGNDAMDLAPAAVYRKFDSAGGGLMSHGRSIVDNYCQVGVYTPAKF